MNLFEFIRYNDIDLESFDDVSKLPFELFCAYRIAAFNHYGNHCGLSKMDATEIKGMTTAWDEQEQVGIKRVIFDKVLREYCNDNLSCN